MLVLSRRVLEELVLGPLPDGSFVLVNIVGVKGGRVQLGVEAAREVNIVRGELVQPVAAGGSQ
jgi:carbon storage regulator CsrA